MRHIFLTGLLVFCVELPLCCHTLDLFSKEKPGTCPIVHASCLLSRERNQCRNDEKCPGDKKCCQGNPESCPTVTTTCTGPVQDQCAIDDQCTNGRKCCLGPCGKACLVPDKVKPGVCPGVSQLCSDVNFKNECENDEECPHQKKCCVNVCGKACVFPVQVLTEVPKSCPIETIKCPRIFKKNCQNDYDCGGLKKCCSSNCSLRCVDPQ